MEEYGKPNKRKMTSWKSICRIYNRETKDNFTFSHTHIFKCIFQSSCKSIRKREPAGRIGTQAMRRVSKKTTMSGI